jgi:hypothetical protein
MSADDRVTFSRACSEEAVAEKISFNDKRHQNTSLVYCECSVGGPTYLEFLAADPGADLQYVDYSTADPILPNYSLQPLPHKR